MVAAAVTMMMLAMVVVAGLTHNLSAIQTILEDVDPALKEYLQNLEPQIEVCSCRRALHLSGCHLCVSKCARVL